MIIGNVKGISKSTRALLAEHGIFSVEELAQSDVDRLLKIPGFTRQKAERMVRSARHVVGDLEKQHSAMRLQGIELSAPSQGQTADAVDLADPRLYINRELSLLDFNWRVLEQAKDERTPLLERLNFLAISCSNLDEFFEVRVAGLNQKAELGSSKTEPDSLSPQEALAAIGQRTHELVAEQYRVLNELLLPQLEAQNICFVRRTDWNASQQTWLRRYFEEELLPILSPMGLDPSHPFPRILNKSLNFILSLSGKDAFGRDIELATLQAPRALPRIVHLPPGETESGPHDFVFLSSIIHAFVDELFYGVKVRGCYQFRVTRNSDLFLDDEEFDDLLHAVEGELTARNFGDEVRLEVADNCPDGIVEFLLGQFGLAEDRLYRVEGPVNLSRAREVYDMIERPDLKYPPFIAGLPRALASYKDDIFELIRKQDILLHHPYESFAPVIELVWQAARDPQVVAIKQTLYRTGSDSPLVEALVHAARAGKEVTVVVELLARFDEKANISLANRLQEAGVQVVYGIVGYKTHAKMLLVLRREGRNLRYYTHLGTGNYHSRTSRIYTDYGLFTCDKELGEDVRRVFVQLTSLGKVSRLNKLLHSPFTLHSSLIKKINREIEHARHGRSARIVIKINSVDEPQLIQALYRASMAGVKIVLIVRGVCCLRPGVAGVSENIEVRSIIGRFLEHSRVYYFENGGEPEIYAASADFMKRNMFRRVESCFPIENRKLGERIRADLARYLADNSQAWLLKVDGSYQRLTPAGGEEVSVQAALLKQYAEPY
ncbi:polyphosphate kinase 1 [Methylococcus sp. EFPC2]|uniref:polyphosphate kinase 1 n=1 Tax=Methylococcus sp. EFPC2 TaxID=2812648 RepID=UPI001967828F|nr:polyphosphate kinase 1 [Methylococcus sp. EFPC2]QSA95575.1 polyphosphate kinase 1 [Methylococcus sp. EFPC2]